MMLEGDLTAEGDEFCEWELGIEADYVEDTSFPAMRVELMDNGRVWLVFAIRSGFLDEALAFCETYGWEARRKEG